MIKFLIGVAVGIAGTLIYVSYREENEWVDEEMDAELDDIERSMNGLKECVDIEPITNLTELNHKKRIEEKRKRPMVVIDEPSSVMYETEDLEGHSKEARTYIISEREFEEPYEEFDKFEVEYDVSNDLLMDEIGDVVDHEVLASKEIIDKFYEDDNCDVVYVRNSGLDIDYMITKVDGNGNRVKKRPRQTKDE